MSLVIPHSKQELADLIYLKLGRNPIEVRTQALLVIGEFDDGQLSIHHINDLDPAYRR